MAERKKSERIARVTTAEKLALGITALALALTLGYRFGTDRSAPELTVRSEAALTRTEAATRSVPAAELIDLNSASAEELQTLKGVGPALAERIIAYRTEHGPFQRVEDITLVKGIGAAVYEENRTRMTVGEGTT